MVNVVLKIADAADVDGVDLAHEEVEERHQRLPDVGPRRGLASVQRHQREGKPDKETKHHGHKRRDAAHVEVEQLHRSREAARHPPKLEKLDEEHRDGHRAGDGNGRTATNRGEFVRRHIFSSRGRAVASTTRRNCNAVPNFDAFPE